MTLRRLLTACATLACAAPAAAHPGHGDPRYWGTWQHYVHEPGHFAVLSLVVFAGAAAIGYAQRRAAERRRGRT